MNRPHSVCTPPLRRCAAGGWAVTVLSAAVILGVCLPRPQSVGATQVIAESQPTSVDAAFTFCGSHPATQRTISVRGWFVPSIAGSGHIEGGLFNSRSAVPITTVDQWDGNGSWRKYGALYAHITTRASFGPRSLTLHGRLVCASDHFSTDRDPFPPPGLTTVYGTTGVGNSGPITTWATAGGLKLTLTIPRRSYPRDALTKVTVSIRNVSRHEIGYWTTGVSLPGVASPQAQVLDGSGQIVFPPAMPYMPPLPGPAPALVPLHPGQTVDVTEFIVVRGARLRASQSFTPHWTTGVRRAANILATHPITVGLTSEPAPRLALRVTSGEPAADVTRPPGVGGPPLWLDYADCDSTTASGPAFNYSFVWVEASSRLLPGCSPVRAWHVRLAWLDHPVAALDYTAPQPAPTASPPPRPASTPTRATATPVVNTPSFVSLLRRADHAMASVHTLHATGTRMSVDPSAEMSLRIQAVCRSQSDAGIRITSRSLVSGQQSQAGRIDEGYILDGPVLSGPAAAMRAWHRSPTTHGQWQSIVLWKQWGVDQRLSDPIWSPDPAYLNQVCPDLIRPTYLASPLPSAQHTVYGLRMVDGDQTWHLRERLWFTLDLFIDARSFRLRRLVLWDRPGPAHHWQVRFDYSRLNAPVQIALPRRSTR